MNRRLAIYSYLACAALAIGSLGRWATGPLGYSGISGDGILTLCGAGFAALTIWRWTASQRRPMLIVAQVVAVLCAAVAVYAIYDTRDFYSGAGETWANRVGWGLILTLLAAIALTVLCFLQYRCTHSGESWSISWPKIGLLMGVAAVLAWGVASAVESDHPIPEAVWLDGEPGLWTTNSRALDRKVLALRPGMSIEVVRSRLGNPVSAIALKDEVALFYGTWQLVFTDEGLETRTRHYKPRYRIDHKALGRKIMRLQLGTSIEAVESKLGRPESLEIFKNPPRKEESLWYSGWSLSFTAGRLEGRYK